MITHLQVRRRLSALAAASVAFALIAGIFDGGVATRDASAQPVPCAAPSVPSADATPVASPEEAASPAAIATPGSIATPLAAGDAIDPGTDAAIRALVGAVAACQTAGDAETLGTLVTAGFLSQVYGGGEPLSAADFAGLAADLPATPVAVQSVGEVTVDAAGLAEADVLTIVSRQLVHGRWSFLRQGAVAGDSTGAEGASPSGAWRVDGVQPLAAEAPAGASEATVTLADGSFKPSKLALAGPDVALRGVNAGSEDHKLLVVKLGKGAKMDQLLTQPGPQLPAGITFIGQQTIPAGESGELVLVGLAPGRYEIVDLLPTDDGTPHLALGMKASLTVR